MALIEHEEAKSNLVMPKKKAEEATRRKEKKFGLAVALFSLLEPITPFSLTGAMKRVFLPFWKRPLCVVVWPLVIIVTTICYLQTGIAELHRLNLMEARVLGAELKHEAGPEWLESSRRQAMMIGNYINEMNGRHLASVAKWSYPEHDLIGKLASIKQRLAAISSEEEAKRKMPALGMELIELCDKVGDSFKSSIIWRKFDSVDPERARDIKTVLRESEDALLDFKEDVTEVLKSPEKLANEAEQERVVKKGRELCMTHRRAWELLFLHRLGYNDKKGIRAFGESMGEASRQMTVLASKIRGIAQDDPDAGSLDKYAASERKRSHIIDVMLEGDMQKLCDATEAFARDSDRS